MGPGQRVVVPVDTHTFVGLCPTKVLDEGKYPPSLIDQVDAKEGLPYWCAARPNLPPIFLVKIYLESHSKPEL